ncbi:MAG: hypothetical protein FWH03_03480 [Firmicutes bacterium]|nr:hypothetical protein [Bacillota bacterium]
MDALYIILLLMAGLMAGAGVTYTILYLLQLKAAARQGLEFCAPTELAKHSKEEDISLFMQLGAEQELTLAEIADIHAEEAEAEKTPQFKQFARAEEAAAQGGEATLDEEMLRNLAQANAETEAFILEKKANGSAAVPALRFTLSREDVFDYIDDMWEALCAAEENPVLPGVVLRAKKHYCDALHCGEWCFALMYERGNVLKFIVRLDDATAAEVAARHTAFKRAQFPKGENFYSLIVDQSFTSKEEVYKILDAAFAYVLNLYYRQELSRYVTDIEAARLDAHKIQQQAAQNADTADEMYAAAIAEYNEALKIFMQRNKPAFFMTRKRMLHYVRKSLPDTAITEREKRYMPASLKINQKTYALVYEKIDHSSTDNLQTYVSLIVRISDAYAKWLCHRHPRVRRARFPNNRNWYVVPVDGSFYSAQMAYRVLKHAKQFVQ